MGTQCTYSTIFHPQTDRLSERTIQTLEDFFKACLLDFGGSWEKHLSLVEFSYNNNYKMSMCMTPFETLYGNPCRFLASWVEGQEQMLVGQELIQ